MAPFGFLRKTKTIADVARPLTVEQLKRLSRIVVVDDQPDSVPTDDLRANGYVVEYWSQIDAAQYARLERGDFEIIILDIQGIVRPGFSDTGDGLGILRRLKKHNPAQIVVACSGQSYRIDATEFYKLADATLAKPITLLRAMETLDEVIRSSVRPEIYWGGVERMLGGEGVDKKQIRKLEIEVANAIANGKQVSSSRVSEIVGNIKTIVTVAELISKVIFLTHGSH